MTRSEPFDFKRAARKLFVLGVAPFGAWQAERFFGEGMPQEFRPALGWLFGKRLMPEDAAVVARVEKLRATFANSGKTYKVMTSNAVMEPRSAEGLALNISVTQEWGTFLYLLAKGFRAASLLELGSCVGISASYLGSVSSAREFISIERSPELAAVAQSNARQILPGMVVVNAAIDDVLDEVLTRFSQGIGLYYIDAFHQYEPTFRYFEKSIPYLKKGALVIFDDIHWSKGMWEVWEMLRMREGFSHTLDVGRFGLGVWDGGMVKPRVWDLARYAGWVRGYSGDKG